MIESQSADEYVSFGGDDEVAIQDEPELGNYNSPQQTFENVFEPEMNTQGEASFLLETPHFKQQPSFVFDQEAMLSPSRFLTNSEENNEFNFDREFFNFEPVMHNGNQGMTWNLFSQEEQPLYRF